MGNVTRLRVPDLTLTGAPVVVALGMVICGADSSGRNVGFTCTRRRGHSGRHAAGNGFQILEVW